MPPLLMAFPSAPIIIPITVLVVVAVAVILIIFHLIRKLVGCPHQKSKYPFHNQDPSKIKSVLPTSPYTIDPSSTASSNSIYFVKGTSGLAGGLLYPALATATGTPSTGRHGGGPDDSFEERGGRDSSQDQTFSLDTVDGHIEELGLVQSSGSPTSQLIQDSEESHALLPRSSSALGTTNTSTNSSSPAPPYEVEEHTTYRQELSYHRSERAELVTSFGNNGAGGSPEQHYESDV